MFKKVLICIVAVIFLAGASPVFAKSEGKNGPNPNEEAYEHANQHAKFKRTDGVKDKAAKKVELESGKAKKEAEKTAKKKEKDAKKEAKKMNKELDR